MLKPYIALALNRKDLSAEQAEAAMNIIWTGQATPAQIGAYLAALRMKGETVDEITGSARAMRADAVHVPMDRGEPADVRHGRHRRRWRGYLQYLHRGRLRGSRHRP